MTMKTSRQRGGTTDADPGAPQSGGRIEDRHRESLPQQGCAEKPARRRAQGRGGSDGQRSRERETTDRATTTEARRRRLLLALRLTEG